LKNEDIVQEVVMDGAKNCINAMKIAETKTLLWTQRCAAHGASLGIKDSAKLYFFRDDLKSLVRLISFIRNHSVVFLAVIALGGVALELPVETRFGKLYVCADKVMTVFQSIKRAFVSETVTEWLEANVNTPIDEVSENVVRTTKLSTLFSQISENTIENRSWIRNIKVFVMLMGPIYEYLRKADSKVANLTSSARDFDRAIQKLLSFKDDMVTDEEVIVFEEVLAIYNKRKKDCVSELAHAAAYVDFVNLYPCLSDTGGAIWQQFSTPEGAGAFQRMVSLKCATITDGVKVIDYTMTIAVCEMAALFRRKESIFADNELNIAKVKTGSTAYWREYRGGPDKVLSKLADVCTWFGSLFSSSSSVERENHKVKTIMTKYRVARLGHHKINRMRNIASVYEMGQKMAGVKLHPIPFLDTFLKDVEIAREHRLALDALANQVDDIDLELEEIDPDDEDQDEGWFGMILENQVGGLPLIEEVFDENLENAENFEGENEGNERNVRRRENEAWEDVELDVDLFDD
jgi:hypothetical protein